MRHIARKNRREVPKDLLEKLKEASETQETTFGMLSLFKRPRTRIRTLLTIFVWYTDERVSEIPRAYY
jgi:hypothetical protein